jgi:crotonobetainyl-CoA:carnitine CoA-transferase CaiB-like acyl-CoA transferase
VEEPAAPLAGLRVLDLSRVLAGPLATMVLADLGADVIKVERPGAGDETRGWGPPFVGDDAAYFLSLNRNKRSIALDLGTNEGAGTARRLARFADVVIENLRPGSMEAFGLSYEELSSDNPRLVWCSFTAFVDGEGRPGYDIAVQALSGLMSITGEPGRDPVKVGVALLDVIAGLYAAIGILAAVRESERTGRGRRVSVALFEASVAAMVNQAANHLLGGVVPGPLGGAHPNIVPYQVFRAADRPFVLAAGNDRFFRRTCEVIGRPELADDPRFETNEDRVRNRGALIPILSEAFGAREAAAWVEALGAADVPCAPVRRMDEVFASPEGAATVQAVPDPARGVLRLVSTPIRVDGSLPPIRTPPPRLGEHTVQVLEELDRLEREGR